MEICKWVLGVVVLSIVCLAATAVAEEKAKAQYLTGKVIVKKNDKGVVQFAVLAVEDLDEDDELVTVYYKIMLDQNGQKLAKEMNGKEVDVTCTIQNKGTKEKAEFWIAVTKYEEVKEELDEE